MKIFRVAALIGAVLVLPATGCAERVEPPIPQYWELKDCSGDDDRNFCRDFSTLETRISGFRAEQVVVGACGSDHRDRVGACGGPVYFHLTYARAPGMRWAQQECGRIDDEQVGGIVARLDAAGSGSLLPFPDAAAWIGFPVLMLFSAIVAGIRRRQSATGWFKVALYRVLIGLYAAFAAVWVQAMIGPVLPRVGAYCAIALVLVACLRWDWARFTLGVIAGLHALGALLTLGFVSHEIEPLLLAMLGYLVFNVTVPVGVLMLSTAESRPPEPLNLPAGYAYSLTRRRGLDPFQRVLFVIGFTVAAGFVLFGGPGALLIFAVFVMPVIIGFYLIFHLLSSSGKERLPMAQRRVRVTPKMARPAQTRSHWTVDNSEFGDPDLYDAGSGPRIVSSPPPERR